MAPDRDNHDMTEQEVVPDGAASAAASPDGSDEAQPEPEPETEPQDADADEAEAPAEPTDAEKYLALAQRTQADFENFRKRAGRDVQAAEARGIGKVLRELLPALDNFERALAAAEAEETDAEHHLTKGIRLVQSDLVAALSRVGVEAFSPRGEVFDPNEHEAMAQAPIEGVAPGIVAEVYQQGYRLNGTVLRPAKVVVAA